MEAQRDDYESLVYSSRVTTEEDFGSAGTKSAGVTPDHEGVSLVYEDDDENSSKASRNFLLILGSDAYVDLIKVQNIMELFRSNVFN